MKELTVEEKFAKALLKLRQIRPFFSAIYEVIEKEAVSYVDTMGVTCNKIVYNAKYVDNETFKEFMFDIMHEISHIALMHVVRLEKRDLLLWTIACDLYVNKLLAEEFGLQQGISMPNDEIEMGKGSLYDNKLDVDIDIVEEIYQRLAKQAEAQGYFSEVVLDSDDVQYKEYKLDTSNNPDLYNNFITIRRDMKFDMINNGEDSNHQEDQNKRIIIDAKTRMEMMGDKTAGTTTSKIETLVNKLLESKVDWRKLLRKYCIQYKSRDLSFSSPDKRMFYQDAIYPGESSESEDILKNVKICIDTSGSISTDDLGHFLYQVEQLTKTFKTSAEIINWDTEIECVAPLDNLNVGIPNIDTYKVIGRGGTDPSCLFEYFDSKKCKVKPFVVLVFTDGYIPDLENYKWKNKYKNTIWIMTKDYNEKFKPPFGKLAFAEFTK